MTCDNCTRLQAENVALKQEVKRLSQIINQVKAYCSKVLGDADKVLGGNNPKGVYAYNKAIKDKIEPVANYLSD